MVGSSKIEETQKPTYNRKTELQAFDDTKTGVKGLIDAGITKLPRIFIQPPEFLSDTKNPTKTEFNFPVIDFEKDREEIVDRVREAAENWGFFQVVNHGIPAKKLEEILDGVGRFMEQETEIKKQYYSRDVTKKFYFLCNFDLFSAPAANWRDTIYYNCAPNPPNPDELPSICREIMIEYSKQVMGLGRSLLKLLSESLGLSKNHLIEMECAESLSLICHYSPACPEPDLTFGTTSHSDNDFLTVLLQDNLGGLQVRHQDQWADIPPIPGALIVNIGDLLQELLSEDNPPKYKATTAMEYGEFVRAKGLDGTSALLHFKLQD